MTKQGEPNRFGRFVFTDEQAERVAAGDMSAVWEFIEDNRKHLECWAQKFIRNHLSFLPQDMHGSFYKSDELLNQIFVDFPFYKLENEETLGKSIYCSFLGISCGGSRWSWKHRQNCETSFDAPAGVHRRSGETEEAGTLKDLLPSMELIPSEVVERKEHVEEIAPHYFYEIGRLFKHEKEERESGATIGELLNYQSSRHYKQVNAFQDVIEEVFFGYTFEEIKAYATKSA